MLPNGQHSPRDPGPKDESTRTRVQLFALIALTVAGLLLSVYVAYPLLPALAWALALAVIAFPIHVWLSKVIPNRNVAATLSTAVVVAVVLVPVLLVAGQLGHEAAGAKDRAETMAREGKVDAAAERIPQGAETVAWVRQNVDVEAEARNAVGRLLGDPAAVVQGSVWFLVQLLVAVFVLYFLFRDSGRLLADLRDLSPLPRPETDGLFERVAGSIHATVYATVVTGVLQGITGGLMFWALGLPSPVLWGTVMAVLAILPVVGAFLVWAPAAVALALGDRWGAAAALVTWGVLMAGPICNYLYAWLAGDRMRLHPVPVLVAFVGGLAVFGVSGMVIGPVVLAVTVGFLDIWRYRMGGRAAAVEVPATAPEPAAIGGKLIVPAG